MPQPACSSVVGTSFVTSLVELLLQQLGLDQLAEVRLGHAGLLDPPGAMKSLVRLLVGLLLTGVAVGHGVGVGDPPCGSAMARRVR